VLGANLTKGSRAGVLVGSLAVTRGVTALGRENFLPPLAAVVSHRLGTPIFATAILGIATGAGPQQQTLSCHPKAQSNHAAESVTARHLASEIVPPWLLPCCLAVRQVLCCSSGAQPFASRFIPHPELIVATPATQPSSRCSRPSTA